MFAEVMRLNKKFDVFLKRFEKCENEIKEIKQNFYRVMHCAFAKYEQGYAKKNSEMWKKKE
jgi:vacuolar-type H+-ATPase subunit D/Vma8